MKLKNFFGHLHTVNKHRWTVFKLSIRAGIPLRGLMHDLSKYSFVEFFEGVKYFNGKRSPIHVCKEKNGYSKAWLHHKGRNKHHFEYWYDFATTIRATVIPYKYAVEMVCDNLAAGMVYNGKDWNKEEPLKYFKSRKDLEYINPKIQDFLIEVYTELSIKGINEVITKKNLKRIYEEKVENVKN